MIALDPEADITDVYAFRSWEDPDKLVFILNVIPGQEPSSGPNYFNFDDNVAYDINVDVNQDGKADDVVYRVRFKTAIRAPFNDLPVAYAGVNGVPGLPPIRDLTGPDAAGLGLRQRYTVTEIRNGKGRDLGSGPMFAVPSNIGPRTIPRLRELVGKGDLSPYERRAGLHRTARRDVLYRSRRHVRHAEFSSRPDPGRSG